MSKNGFGRNYYLMGYIPIKILKVKIILLWFTASLIYPMYYLKYSVIKNDPQVHGIKFELSCTIMHPCTKKFQLITALNAFALYTVDVGWQEFTLTDFIFLMYQSLYGFWRRASFCFL